MKIDDDIQAPETDYVDKDDVNEDSDIDIHFIPEIPDVKYRSDKNEKDKTVPSTWKRKKSGHFEISKAEVKSIETVIDDSGIKIDLMGKKWQNTRRST